MTKHRNFFQEQKPAAVLKHALLKEYTTVFIAMIGSRGRGHKIWMIDGYAGPGEYAADAESSRVIPGSPSIALDLAKANLNLRFIFVEKEHRHAASLARLVKSRQADDIATVHCADVGDVIANVWKRADRDPVITFLDPFGVALDRQLIINHLQSAHNRHAPTEVLVNLNVEAVWRIGGHLEEDDGCVVPKVGSEKTIARADAFFGSRNWRRSFYEARGDNGGSAAKAAELVVHDYRDRICEETRYKAVSVPIRRRPDHPTLFLLTLFYTHDAAAYKFADAASRANKRWRNTFHQKDLAEALEESEMSLFEPEVITEWEEDRAKRFEKRLDEEWTERITNNLEAGLEHGDIRVADVHAVYGDTLGLAGEKHLRRSIKSLVERGVARKLDSGLKWNSVVQAVRARDATGI